MKIYRYIIIILTILTVPITSNANNCRLQNDDIYWLAKNIYHESRGEQIYGQLMVGIVTLSRLDSNKWGKSIKSVITSPNQFSWYNADKIYKYNKKEWNKSKNIALLSIILYSYINNSNILYYHTNSSKPYWSKKLHIFKTIGNHTFYFEDINDNN